MNSTLPRAMTGATPPTCSPPAADARSSRATSPAPSTASSPPPVCPASPFHDLRRTTATLLKSLGVPARDAQAILGHSHVSITLGIYSEVFDPGIATALARMNEVLDDDSAAEDG